MSEHALIFEVRLMTDRWHGSGGWPPSPFRLFQALVAGAYGGRWRMQANVEEINAAFRWLERLPPPIVVTPRARSLASLASFVPNNDLDVKGNDPRRTAEIRTQKVLKSTSIESDDPFAYIWHFDGALEPANRLAFLSERLHTFGRGVDAAYARAIVVDGEHADSYERLHSVRKAVASLEAATPGSSLECPVQGSLDSLHRRYNATIGRFRPTRNNKGRIVGSVFRQPPKAELRLVAYDRPGSHLVFDIRDASGQSFYPIRIELATMVASKIRDLAFHRLEAVSESVDLRERIVLGRGAGTADHTHRLRFIPLPSIGARFTDASIRRIAVAIPPDCPFAVEDVRWALAGRPLALDENSEEEARALLVPSADESMLRRYAGRGSRFWRTVTPAVLPVERIRGRLGGAMRSTFEQSLTAAVVAAIRHAGVKSRATDVRVQREPLFERGTVASAFQAVRFEQGRLYHVEIRFAEDVVGPLLIGDGRWLGLGLMRPTAERSRSANESYVTASVDDQGDQADDEVSDTEDDD